MVFLGYILSSGGIRPCAANTRAITEVPIVKYASEIKKFLVLCSYNFCYLPDFAIPAEHLRMLTKLNATFDWGSEQQSAFEKIKSGLIVTPTLIIFTENCVLSSPRVRQTSVSERSCRKCRKERNR